MIRHATYVILSAAAIPAAAEFSLAFPVDCELGNTCYIQHLVDHDPDAGVRDFACGALAYDDHGGTDIALPSLKAQSAGVAVLAAAPGIVTGVRNDMIDRLQFGPEAPDVTDRECGNGVVITHDNGYETQYCHLAQGSVSVAVDDRVAVGLPLGLIGLSGKTQFPHLHFTVRHRGTQIDPFDTKDAARCDDPLDTLWDVTPDTPQGGIISIGLHAAIPDYGDVKAGIADENLSTTSPAIVGWTYVFMGRAGDELATTVRGPEGTIVDHISTLDRDQAQLMRATGLRAPQEGWPVGSYVLQVELSRDGTILDSATKVFNLN